MTDNPLQHVMLDLETWSTKPDALVWAIGACKFDPNGEGIDDAFHVVIDPADAARFDFDIDAGTVLWWMNDKQEAARKKILEDYEPIDFLSALEGFRLWFGTESLPVWGNGAAMDNVILRNAYEQVGDQPPWSYRDDRCYRTMKNKVNVPDPVDHGTAHVAVDDAVAQALHLQAIIKHLGIKA